MRLNHDLYLVGGGPLLGFGLSPGQDGHIYLVVSEGESAFIDCGLGTPASRRAVLENIRSEGIDPSSLKTLMLTHYHPDHAGGASAWQSMLGLQVLASEEAVPALQSADVVATGLRAAQEAGLYDRTYNLEPVTVNRPLTDGDHIDVGSLRVTFLSTPGHCHGHGCYLVEGGRGTYLFSGDSVLHGGRIILQNIPDCDIAAYASTATRLATLEFDALLPGHGPVALNDGKRHVSEAAAQFAGVGLPSLYQ